MIAQWKSWKNRQAGAAIVVIIAAMTIVAIMGAAMQSLFSSSTFSELFINNRNKAYYLAQAGRNYAALTILNAYSAGDMAAITDLNGQTFTLDGNQFYLSTNIQSAGITVVESTGIANPDTALETKQKMAFTVRDPTLVEGAASVGNVTLNSGSFIDGYDSTGGHIYNAAVDQPQNLAIIQTNSMAAGAVTLNHSSVIWGKAYCGVGCPMPDFCDGTGVFVCNSGSTIKSGTAAATKNYDPTPLTLPSLVGVPVQTINLNDTDPPTNINAGKYEARDPSNSTNILMNGSIINISGLVTLIVNGTLTMIRGSTININPGGILILWIKTSLSVGGDSRINYQGQPPNVLIKGIALTTLDFVNQSKTYCSIYAPGSIVSLNNTTEMFGSIYAGTINLNGGTFHCDMALAQSAGTYVGY
jgi:hypothetical protein